MLRVFNIAGPCRSDKHYMIDATRRLGSEIEDMIADEQYFAIHAARQSGKTTLVKEMAGQINEQGSYYALYC